MKNDLPIVYHIPLNNNCNSEKALFSLECTLKHRMFRLLNIFTDNEIVGIKLNSAYPSKNEKIHSKYYHSIANLLYDKSISPILCDTSNRFKNRTMNAAKYMQQLFESGFSCSETKTPFLMLDGANGKSENTIKENSDSERDNIYIAGELNNLNGMIVTSLTSPSTLAGFKGALYNLGFGLAACKGKIKLSTMSTPQVNTSRCYYCRKCLHECPTNAIFLQDRHVEINPELCIDCGKCVDIALYGGISYSWNATPEYFQKNLIQYVNSILNLHKNKLLFINFMPNHMNINDNPFSDILISKDPYAIDSETLKRIMFDSKNYSLYRNSKYKLETINY